jgi:hypothetical protein
MPHRLPPPLWPLLQGQPFFLVEPVDQILAHVPALTSKKNQNLAVPISDSALRDLADPGPQLRPRLLVALVTIDATHHAHYLAGMPLAGPKLVAKIVDQRPAPRGLHHFFRSTS